MDNKEVELLVEGRQSLPEPMPLTMRFIKPNEALTWSVCRKEYADLLEDGEVYEVDRIEEHTYHTRIYLVGFDDIPFNSVWFDWV